MAKFRKKPVEIEAVLLKDVWTDVELDPNLLPEWVRDALRDDHLRLYTDVVKIETLEGWMTGQYTDWLICGVQGEMYACKPDVFEKTYEAVEDYNDHEPLE